MVTAGYLLPRRAPSPRLRPMPHPDRTVCSAPKGSSLNTDLATGLSLSMLAMVGAILGGRLIVLRSSRFDRWVSAALGWALLCCVLRHEAVQRLIEYSAGFEASSLLYHLSEIVVIPCAGALFVLGLLWLGVDVSVTRARLVNWSVAICAAATLWLLLDALSGSSLRGVLSGWAVIAYAGGLAPGLMTVLFHDVLIYCAAIIFIILCVRELRDRPHARELATCVTIALISLAALLQSVAVTAGTIFAATGRHSTYVHVLSALDRATPMLYACFGAVVAGAPLLRRVLQRAELDRFSRLRRRLTPLWNELVTVCPEVVYRSPSEAIARRPQYRLHRIVVEIRDCILILSRYANAEDEAKSDRLTDDPVTGFTIRLALACRSKMAGDPPTEDFPPQQSSAADLVDDALELLQVAKRWPQAKSLARSEPASERAVPSAATPVSLRSDICAVREVPPAS